MSNLDAYHTQPSPGALARALVVTGVLLSLGLAPAADPSSTAGQSSPEAGIPADAEALPFLPPYREAARADLPAGLTGLDPGSVDGLRAMEEHVRRLVERVSPAAVAVRVGMSTGSGVVISPDGLVLSAAHVGGEPGREVRFNFPDGRVARGKTLGTDHRTDAGLMQITEVGPWPFVDLGDPGDCRLGDWVLALGHPSGYDPERPVLVRLGRVLSRTGEVLRTDCTLVSGDSGGPLFDMHGRVIGIHTRISESVAANFHAPVASYVANWDRLARGDNWGARGPRSRAWVGLRGADHPDGFRLDRVFAEGPADRAGLQEGDVVKRCNGQAVANYDAFLQALSGLRPGEKVRLGVARDDDEWEVELTVENRRRGPGPFGGSPSR